MDDESMQDEGQSIGEDAAGEVAGVGAPEAATEGVGVEGLDPEGIGTAGVGASADFPDSEGRAGQSPAEQTEQEGFAPDFEQLSGGIGESEPAALSLLYDLDLPVAIELGRTRLSVQDILALGRGSVVQLDRQAGEPVDVYVGDRRFAEGEVVIVGEQFGVRITRIVNTAPVAAVSAG